MEEIAEHPYAYGNPVDRINDKRRAEVAGTVTVYWISQRVVTISVMSVIHTDFQSIRPAPVMTFS